MGQIFRSRDAAGKFAASEASRLTQATGLGAAAPEYGAAIFTLPGQSGDFLVGSFVQGTPAGTDGERAQVVPSNMAGTVPRDGLIVAFAHSHPVNDQGVRGDATDRIRADDWWAATTGRGKSGHFESGGASVRLEAIYISFPFGGSSHTKYYFPGSRKEGFLR